MNDRPTIEQIVSCNIEAAEDQKHEYDDQSENEFGQWFEGDAYMQNVADTLVEEGLGSHENWESATGLFYKLAVARGLRFAN